MPPVQIRLEFTPNPNTLKFVVNRTFLDRGSANFIDRSQASESPLAEKLFAVEGIQSVMIGTQFITITKADAGDWDTIAEQVPATLEKHLSANLAVFTDAFWEKRKQVSQGSSADVESRIRTILDEEIRPAVAMDGGDILFDKFEDGVVYLHLQGSCSSCPSSVATLKMGVETRLKEAIPEVKEVVQVA